MTSMNGRIEHTICGLLWLWSPPKGSIPMPETTKKDEESEAKAQLERLVKDGDQIANKLPPFTPQRRRGGALSD